jgi:serine/threonine protein phosphatase PrpC
VEIKIVAATSVSPRSPVDVHIGAAFEKGSTDNITAVVVELPSTPAAARSEPELAAE